MQSNHSYVQSVRQATAQVFIEKQLGEFNLLPRLAVEDVPAVLGDVQDVPSLHDLSQAADRHADLHIVEGDCVVLIADEARELKLTIDLHSASTCGFG